MLTGAGKIEKSLQNQNSLRLAGQCYRNPLTASAAYNWVFIFY